MVPVPAASRIARYEPEELLGSSGLVDTYRVRVQGEGGKAALKVLFVDRAEAGIARPLAERFLAAGLRALDCEVAGIARVLEVSDDPESAFVATEFQAGVDLNRLVELGRGRSGGRDPVLDPVLAGLVCAQVARVLAAAHELKSPLFHLGLSPGNVVVAPAARVMVLDFGLAASLRGMGASPLDKWSFVAPELLGVDATTVPAEVARAADLYSLGALLHFLLSGRQPAPATTLAELAERTWEPLPDIPGVPTKLLTAVRALTAPESSQRPESARMVIEWLSGGLASPQERHDYTARALQALGIHLPPLPELTAPTGSVHSAAGPVVLARRGASALPTAPVPPRGGAAHAVRPGIRRWRWRALLAGAAFLACGISAWGVATYLRPGGHVLPVDAGEPPPPPISESLKSGQVEMTVFRAPDGGLHAGGVDASPTVEPYLPESESQPSRVPNHLFLDTNPSQADVWVDGVLRGKTPVDLVAGPGSHRVVIIKPGYRMLRAVFDTTRGDYARRGLQRAGYPNFGDAILDVQCEHAGKYPVVLDDEETGLLCPVSRLPVASGRHHIGIFVPAKRMVVAVEVTVPPGREPKLVMLRE